MFRSLSQTWTRRYGAFFAERTHVNFTAPFGLLSPAQMNALVVQRYLHEHGWPAEVGAAIALLGRANAQHNPRAQTYGRPKTLAEYHVDGLLPAIEMPGGRMSTYQSFIDMVLTAARPGFAPTLKEIADRWYAEHGVPLLRGVA